MEYNGLVADVIFNLILYIIWVAFQWRVLDGRRFSVGVTILIFLPLFALSMYIPIKYLDFGAQRILFMPVIPLLLAFILFKGKPVKKFLAVFVELAASILSEMILAPGTNSLQFDETISVWIDPGAMLYGIMSLIIVSSSLIICSLPFTRSKDLLPAKQLVVFAAFPLTQLLSTCSMQALVYSPPRTEYVPVLLILCFLYIMSDIALYRTFIRAEKRIQLEITNKLLENQLDAQLSHYDALTKQYENIRSMRHDIYHHLNTISILLQENRTQEASEYAEQILPMGQCISKLGECRNPVVDAFLYNRIKDAEAKGIKVSSSVILPASLPISNTSLIVLFGNIMDNAMEACSGVENAEIELKAFLSKAYLVVTESNTITKNEKEKHRRIPELERGVGFRILSDLAKRYEGSFSHEVNNDRFELSLILKAEAEQCSAQSTMTANCTS